MKKVFLGVIFFLGAFWFSLVQAQEIALLKSGIIIDTVIQQAKVAEWNKDKSVYIVEFEMSNNLDKDQTGIKYALELYNSNKEYGKFLVDQKVYDEVVNFNPKETVLKRIQYNFPRSFQGEYEIQLLIATEDGIELDRKVLSVIDKEKSDGILVDITQCQNKIGYEEQHIFKELDLTQKQSFEIRCKDLRNLSKSDLTFYPKITIKKQNKFGEIVKEQKLEKKTLKSEQKENFSFNIDSANNGSYRYKGELVLVDEKGNELSNKIYFNYLIKTDENGNSIKDPNENEVMEINQVEVQDDASEAFPIFSLVVISVLVLSLLVIIILIFRVIKK